MTIATPGGSVRGEQANLTGLVLSCIEVGQAPVDADDRGADALHADGPGLFSWTKYSRLANSISWVANEDFVELELRTYLNLRT